MLREYFIELAGRYSDDTGRINELWQEIKQCYTAEGRHYHTLTHLSHMLYELTDVKEQIEEWDTILFALYYHDIVYYPDKGDNEEQSALLAARRLQSISLHESMIKRCIISIMATKDHKVYDADTNYLTDADLSILGQEPDVYEKYCGQIRKEYASLNDEGFKAGRAIILKYFLQLQRIFKTDHFYHKYERQARENLAAELERLYGAV